MKSKNCVLLFLSLFILFNLSCEEEILKESSSDTITIPLGGNSYVTSENDDCESSVSDEGFSDWKETETIYSVFFKVSKTGTLNISLEYHCDFNSTIKVSCNNDVFTVELDKNQETTDIGTTILEKTGYVQVDFQGIEKEGTTFAEANNLIISGEATNGDVYFVDDFSYYWGRRGPSVHLYYSLPENETPEWFYNEIRVPEGYDPVGSFFMANGFNEGYFGMQVNSTTERKILFSVWSPYESDDPTDIPEDQKVVLLSKGENVYTGEFGNEGSGGQSYLIYPWKTDVNYGFLTRIYPDDKGSTIYTSYFFDPMENEWFLIASFSRPNTNTYFESAYSFVENFYPEYGYLTRKAFFQHQWIKTSSGTWIEINNASFSADETAKSSARMDYKGGSEESSFFLQNGGFFNDYTPVDAEFERNMANKKPVLPM